MRVFDSRSRGAFRRSWLWTDESTERSEVNPSRSVKVRTRARCGHERRPADECGDLVLQFEVRARIVLQKAGFGRDSEAAMNQGSGAPVRPRAIR
jgi:hypothetical protein